jgi:DNA-binding NtrC family response regulator
MTQAVAKKIVVIDDERPVLLTLEALLNRHGYEIHVSGTGAAGTALIEKINPDLVLLDLFLPDMNGLDLLADLKKKRPQMQVIILSAQDTLNNAIECIKLGAFHFISKPYASEELLSLISRALEQRELVKEAQNLRAKTEQLSKRLEQAEQQLAPVFKSRRMKEIEDLLSRVAPSEANILLTGESGVGKEVLANQIHRMSNRSQGPMVKLNCAAFPQNMIEAELFGYVKGAFTGAVNDFPGMIQEANNGTLFLDEIAEMPPELQTRFLRVLQEREFRPLGSTKNVKANFRLVAATNRVIADAVRDGTLRQDLYYRLNTFQIQIPPLRERKEDIPFLISTFAKRFAAQMNKPEPTFAPEAFQILLDYSWPGNVRELQNAVEYSVVLTQDNLVTPQQLPREMQLPVILQNHQMTAPNADTLNLESRERETIIKALAQCHGNKKKAASILGIHRPTLYSKMKRYAIEL